jgi:AraC family transcriptional regulator, L-rhamnose operon transcriptional activator RhaR
MIRSRRRARYEWATVFNPDGLPVWADHHPLEADVAAHDHDFFEIALVTQGRGVHIAADGDHILQPGSAVLIPPNQWHAYGQCEDLMVFDSFITPDLLDGSLSFLDADLSVVQTVHTVDLPQRVQLSPPDMDLAVTELNSISDVTGARRSRIQALGHLLIFLDILNRAWSAGRAVHGRPAAPVHTGVSRAVELMEAQPGHNWTLAELAAVASTERTYLVRLFQRDLGVPPIAFLNRLREQAAAKLLVQTDHTVAQIGAQLGWDDAGYFARRFKRAYGLSPSAYRRRAFAGETRYHSSALVESRQ